MAERRTTTSVLSFSFILLQLFVAINAVPFTKYGRTCSDIGCLSSEVCVMAYDSCSYNQRENKECGRYPTCKKSGSGGSTGPDTSRPSNTPENTYPSRPSAPVAPAVPSYPSTGGGGGGGSSYPSSYPTYPSYPSSGGGGHNVNPGGYVPPGYGGGSSYGGGGSSYGGGGSSFGGGSSYGDDSYGGRGGYRPTTKKPSSSSGFGNFFSGLLSGGFDSLIQNALSGRGGSGGTSTGSRGGSGSTLTDLLLGGGGSGSRGGGSGLSSLFGGGGGSSSGGGFGSLFDTRHLIENRNYGGLFNEKNPSSSTGGSQTSSTSARGYPTQPPAYAPSYTGGSSGTTSGSGGTSHQSGNTQYGWKV